MKTVAIDIDFLIRDWVTALINTYKKQIDDTWDGEIEDMSKIWEYFKFPVYTIIEVNTDDPDIVESVMVVDESKEYEVNRKHFNKFVTDNILEIFGHAKEVSSNVMLRVNKLEVDKDYKVTLVAKAKGKLIPATLFFLSKVGCEIKAKRFFERKGTFFPLTTS